VVLLNVVYKISRILLMRFIPQTISKKYATIASMLMFDVKFNCLLVCSSILSNIPILFKFRTTQKCRNPSVGLAIKARACKGASQVWGSRVTFHAPRSAKEGEGMNPYTPKWASTLGVGILVDFQIFRERFQGSKSIRLKSSLYIIENLLEFRCLKWARMTHLDI